MTDIKQRVAMKALIINERGEVLILREAASYSDGTQRGRYHMPGGRVEPGEHFEEALKREVREESGLDVEIDYPIYVGEWRPVIKGVPHQIIAMFMVCKLTSDNKITLSSEHDKYLWINPKEHTQFDIMDPEDKVLDAHNRVTSR